MHRLTSVTRRKPALLLAAAALLSLALSLPSARPVGALTCGPGCAFSTGTIYYTSDTYQKVLCVSTCGNACDKTSPYWRLTHTCCCE